LSYIKTLINALEEYSGKFGAYFKWYVHTNNFTAFNLKKTLITNRAVLLYRMMVAVALLVIAFSVFIIVEGAKGNIAGGVYFGLASLVVTPFLLAMLAPLLQFVAYTLPALHPKTIGKSVVCRVLERQATQLRNKNSFKIVVVAGSMGKTSTKLAIAQTLEHAGLSVRYQNGNYNDRLTVPLVLFDQELPSLLNALAWLKVFLNNRRIIRSNFPYDAVVLELGTDGPGQLAKFAYLKPDIALVTGIAAEHMEYFGSLDAVANEELETLRFSKKTLINTDDVPATYRKGKRYTSYGLSNENEYRIQGAEVDLQGQIVECLHNNRVIVKQKVAFIGPQGRKIIAAAFAVGDLLKLKAPDMAAAFAQLKPPAGRMQQLHGIKGATIIDDSYNATPAAVEVALAVLQKSKASKRIAVLGSMNELGNFSAEAHRTIGESIDPERVSLVVTIGEEANRYLAPAAQQNKCNVVTFLNPKKAGEYVKDHIEKDTVVLVKGSQNGVFSEEAIKPLLADKKDVAKLVRQSKYWMNRKRTILNLK
jgi:UDP-N-acetylmuramoyl-tripeptide--D-alanyl-D-alanine ligase